MARDSDRHANTLNAMEAAGLESLVCFSPAHVLLLSGYWPVMGSSVAVFTRNGEVIVLLPEDELDLAKATTEAELIAYRPVTLQRLDRPAEALVAPLRALSKRLKMAGGSVGTASHDYTQPSPYPATHHFHHTTTHLAQELCPDATILAADDLLEQMQAVKTPTEIGLMKRAALRAKTGFDAAATMIAAGRREDEVAASAGAAFARVANDGFERGFGQFFCMSGPNSTAAAAAYARTRRRLLERGDVVMVHANTTGDGYWTDISRTFVVGEANARQRDMQEAIAEARDAALRAIAPGVKARAVDSAAREVLKRRGFGDAFKHGAGHGVGFAAVDANARPRLHPVSDDMIEEGMTFNVEPAIYIEGVGGMRHCDVVACGADGAEVLTDF
ncbi:MAG TPA: Xaa-Pro peptidase family protein [Acidobacteriaceae bacterium]